MIEVMIALLVFSVGMLGIASLQLVSLKTSFEAEQRYEATVLVDDLLSRIFSSGIPLAQRSDAYGEIAYDSTTGSPVAPVKLCNAIDSGCTQEQMVAWDIYEWQLAIKAQAVQHDGESQGLKGAKGCLSFPDDISPRVTVVWESMTDIGAGPVAAQCGGVTDGRYRHYSGPRRSG